MKKFLFLILLLPIFVVAQNVEANLFITQKGVIKTTDMFSISFYDNLKSSETIDSPVVTKSGYEITLVFVSHRMSDGKELSRLFYKGAECKIDIKAWETKLTGNCEIFDIKGDEQTFFILVRGDKLTKK